MSIRSFLASLACAVVLIGSAVAVVAQDATPETETVTAGVTRQPLTSEAVSHLEGMAGPLTIERLRIPAGASVTMTPEDGELVLIVMERGTLEGSSPADVTVQHQTQGETATAVDIAAGSPISLTFGDVLVSLAPVGMELHATGDEQAMVVRIGIGSDRPIAEMAASENEEGMPSGLVMALSLVVPPACPPGTAPEAPQDAATPLAGGGGGGSGAIAVALAAAPACVAQGTPTP